MRSRLRTTLISAFGIAATVAIFALLFRRISVADVAAALRRVSPLWFVPLIALVALGELLRAVKWALILRPIGRVAILRLFGAIMTGYFVNLVSPLRVSPLVRAYMVHRRSEIPTATVLATATVDRLADGLVSAGLLAIVLLWMPLPASLHGVRTVIARAGWALLALYVAAVVLLVLAAHAPHRGGRFWLALSRPFPRRQREWVVRAVRRFIRGLVLPRTWGPRTGILLLALAQKAAQVWQLQLAARAFGVHLTWGAALFLVLSLGAVVLAAGTLGIRGGYVAAAAVGLGWFGVPTPVGLGMGLVTDVSSYAAVLIAGPISLWVEGVGVSDLRAWRRGGNR